MSEIQKLLQEKLGFESTSSVPSDSKKSEDSGLGLAGGLGVLGATGLGIYALARRRLPGAKLIDEIATKKIPQLPVSRNTDIPGDPVAEILNVVPTKAQQAVNVAPSQYQQFIDQFKQLRDVSKTKPLTLGGKKERFGSALYDYLAQHPANKPLPADQWIKEFSNFNRLSSIELSVPGAKIRASITKEELFDTNIAQFNKEGKLVGGFLRLAKENNLPVSKLDLIQMVEKSPAVNTVIKRFRYAKPEKMLENATDYVNDELRLLDDVSKKLDDYYAKMPTQEKVNIQNLIVSVQKDIMEAKSRAVGVRARFANILEEGLPAKQFPQEYFTSIKKNEKSLSGLGRVRDSIKRELNIDPEQFISQENLSQLANKGRAISRNISLQANFDNSGMARGLTPRYGDQYSYRMSGSEDYFEDVAFIKKIPYDKNIKPGVLGAQRHYENVEGENFVNQIYHNRYGKRSLEGNPNKKVYAIDEIQSDVQAVAFPADPTRSKVINPFNTEQEFNQANVALNNLKNKMKVLTDKGAAMTDKDKIEFRLLASNFDELRKKTLNASNVGKNLEKFSYTDENQIPYLPFFSRDSYGDHALKQTLKSAAENNISWVVVNPVERLHALRNLAPGAEKPYYGKLGDWEFYGSVSGKAGRPGVYAKSDTKGGQVKLTDPKLFAVIPDRMRDLARQYNTEAKTINVSLSDPNKPFKIVKSISMDENAAKALGVPKELSKQHRAAFKTQAEAIEWKRLTGEGGEIVRMEANDPNLYYPAFGIKVTETMKGIPFKLYKKEGGLVVNIFA